MWRCGPQALKVASLHALRLFNIPQQWIAKLSSLRLDARCRYKATGPAQGSARGRPTSSRKSIPPPSTASRIFFTRTGRLRAQRCLKNVSRGHGTIFFRSTLRIRLEGAGVHDMSKLSSDWPEPFVRLLANEIAVRRPELVAEMRRLETTDSDITPVGDELRSAVATLRPTILGFDRISLASAVRLHFRRAAGLQPLAGQRRLRGADDRWRLFPSR
ncbi:hypothetical protein GJW-30_1_02594 [Variibacter gotjawalensis]|uniref:Uncharacterized protein n=1 Tax=Variibacter gotjawalensis TaxID=1333996 RepID=A0A0S3PVX4_9BRAD|nr:hypothetical protein EV661_0198 [Variibacter gotjawalensis]BAT60059.1 hypothetical protein GJW-30_1_02594 [Variibacter gotjawalensis]